MILYTYNIANYLEKEDNMDSIVKFFEEKLAPVASRVSTQRHLMAIRDGLVLTMPLMIVGSIIIIFSTDFPVPGWAEFIISIFYHVYNWDFMFHVFSDIWLIKY